MNEPADQSITDVLHRARATPLAQGPVQALGATLAPTETIAAVHRAHRELDEHAVTVLLCALAAASRLPPSAQFVPALALVRTMSQFLGLLQLSPDDPTAALLDLIEAGTASDQRDCMALFVIAERHRHRPEGTAPDARACRLIRQRMHMRLSPDLHAVLAIAAGWVRDAGVSETAAAVALPSIPAEDAQRVLALMPHDWRQFVPERPEPKVQFGTIRRQAPKVQRNDSCPCGSGKKFKKCCAGKEGEEAEAVVATLAPQDIWYMRVAEVARLDPASLDQPRLITALRVALRFRRWELAERFMTALDGRADAETADDVREELCDAAASAGAAEVVQRNIRVARDPGALAAKLDVGTGLLARTRRRWQSSRQRRPADCAATTTRHTRSPMGCSTIRRLSACWSPGA